MLTLNSPAKINLFLNIRDLRPDGFHEIVTVMQTIDLCDTLSVEITGDTPGIDLVCSDPVLSKDPSKNLIVKAYWLFAEETGWALPGVKVTLEKRIPMEAGLGGGSSNAAAMLLALNTLTGNKLTEKKSTHQLTEDNLTANKLIPNKLTSNKLNQNDLFSLAAKLGSDVPFFLSGGLALATGRGEAIEPLDFALPETPLIVVKPLGVDMSTALAYQRYWERGVYETRPAEPLLEAIRSGGDWMACLWNDFEPVVIGENPEMQKIQTTMKEAGAAKTLLCGSGSALFAIPENGLNPDDFVTRLKQHLPKIPCQIYKVLPQSLREGVCQVV